MYILELENQKGQSFTKIFYDKFVMNRFIVKCKKGKSLKVKGFRALSWTD